MQMPTTSMSSERLALLGRFHVACLEQTEETRALAPIFVSNLEALETAAGATDAARRALIGPRVAVVFGEARLEQELRRLSLSAQQVDNKADGGAAKTALFPRGLYPALRPRGEAQIEAASAVRERLVAQPAAASLREAHLTAVDAAISDQRARLAARGAAYQTYASAFAAELGARESFVAAYSSSAGAIRQLFPRSRDQQDLYFDAIASGRRAPDEPVEDGDDGPADA